MKLWQIVDQIHGAFGQRFQIPASRILRNVSLAQKIAFNKDCRAFEKRTAIKPKSLSSSAEILTTEDWLMLTTEDGFALAIETVSSSAEILTTEDWLMLTTEDGFALAIETQTYTSEQNANVYLFPYDCRIIIKVLNASDVWIDDFLREITIFSPVPSDSLEIAYYRQPQDLTCQGEDIDGVFKSGINEYKESLFTEEDEAKVIVPDEWRWQVLVQLGIALCDTENYGDKTPQSVAEQYLNEFWAAMSKRPNDRKVIMSVGAW